MGLAEKMFSKSQKTCTIRSDCKQRSDRTYFEKLFQAEWGVFVVRRDETTGEFDWATQCCEGETAKYAKPDISSATCRE